MASIDLIIKDKSKIEPILSHARGLIERAIVAGVVVVTLGRPKRTLSQNALMWPLLTDISNQVFHCGRKYNEDDWKDLLTAAFEGAIRTAPSLDGNGVVLLGHRTSRYNKKKFSEFIEYLYAEGTDRGVLWSEKSNKHYNEVMG